MCDFDLIECGYNAADETINFGTRCLAEGGNLYEATTLATLKHSVTNEVKRDPYINAAVQNSRVYFSVDATMRIFGDRQCADVIFEAKFDAVIDTFCVSAAGQYLLICCRNGVVNLIDCGNDYSQVFTMAEIASFQYPFLLVNGTKLAILDLENNNVMLAGGHKFKKIYPLTHMFIALDFEGTLSTVCALTFMVLPVSISEVYQDLLLIAEDNQKQLVVVTADEKGQNYIQLLALQGFTNLYSIKVSNHIHLMSLDSLNDELLYISKIFSNDSVSELRFHVVNETQPEQRYRKLLKKHKYEEAERFAHQFGLDRSLIAKAKAEEILEKTICTSQDIDNLISLLHGIDDDEFRLQCCLNVESFCDIFEDARKILTYGSTLQLKRQEKKIFVEELQKTVSQLLHRLNTFLDFNQHPEKVVPSWSQFSECDLIEEVKMLLRCYEIEKAKIIYSRLDEQTTDRLTELHVSDILNVLDTIPISTHEAFLPVFITVTLSVLPFTFPLFVKWTYKKVFNLEKRGKDGFPDNAIRFSENVSRLMQVGDKGENSFQTHRESLVELSTLFTALDTLRKLKGEYEISIPLEGYLEGPQNVVRLLLNITMDPERYNLFLKKFLCKYMVENHMEPNVILLEEIKEMMKYEESCWVHHVGLILNEISSVREKLDAVKNILSFATVPWCPTIRKIADDALKHPHELTGPIRELIANEPVQIVLRRPVYKIKERQIKSVDDLEFFINRILYCNESTMVEDVYNLCISDEFRHTANMMLIERFIQNGHPEKAVDLLDDNPPAEMLKCAKELAVLIERLLNKELKLPSYFSVDNYSEVSHLIFQRLKENETDRYHRSYNDRTFSLICHVRDLNKHFSIKTDTHTLCRVANRNTIIDQVLEDARHVLETGESTIDQLFVVCDKLGGSLGVDKDEILVKFCDKCGDYNVIVKAAQRVYASETSVRNLCFMTVLLMKYVGTTAANKQNVESIDEDDSETSVIWSDSDCVVNDEVFCKGLSLAQDLTAKALGLATIDDDREVMEVARWVNTSFYMTRNQNCETKKELYGNLYAWVTLLPGFLTFSTIRNIFVHFCGYARLKKKSGVYMTTFSDPTITEEDFFRELKRLPPVLDQLIKEGQHFTAYQLLKTIQTSLIEIQLPNDPRNDMLLFLDELVKHRCVPKVLWSVLSNKTFDPDFVYALLLACDHEEGGKIIVTSWKMHRRHPRKLECISKIALRFLDHYSMTSGKKEIWQVLFNIKWWKKFETKKFEYDAFFKMSPENRLEFLINADCLNMQSAKEYCEDYGLSLDGVHKYFFKKVFVNWKPEYEVRVDGNRRNLVVTSTENDLLDKVNDVMNRIDKKYALETITSTWNSVNPYYYEVFIAMIHVLSTLDPKNDKSTQLATLFFLKNYQRVSKPSDTEREQWYTTFPYIQSVDPLSEFRLSFTPFLFSKQIFDIIRPELNLKTYKLWFNAIDVLPALTKDEICSFVVKEIVTSGVLMKSDEWVLYPKHEDLFQEIDECVMHISNLELTTSVVYHLFMHVSNGADKVAAAKLCYKYALEYRRQNGDSSNVEKAVTKVEKKYFTYAAMHILYTHQLADDSYMHLLNQPKELICALYMNERILKTSSVGFQCRDINKAAEALATLFNLDIKKIRYNLVANYLWGDESTSMDFDSSILPISENCNEDENLNRIAYICCSDGAQFWRTQLLDIGAGDDSGEQKSAHCKTKALKVFAMITDVETISQMTELSYDEFRNYIDKVTIVSNLQYLGIWLTTTALDEYNKKELLSLLVKRTGHNLAIKTMALVAMTYKIYDVKAWEFIVNNSISFSMFSELRVYVNFLKKVKFLYKNFYINAWQKLIDHSFENLSSAKDLQKVLLANFLTIQSCPVVHSLNFDNACRRCISRDKPEFAAVLLQYLPANSRDEYVKQIRNSNKDLVSSLSNLDQNGLWGISYVKTIMARQ